MKHYRNQPQAASHVYRSVLLHPRGTLENSRERKESEEHTQPLRKSPPPTPTRPAATSTVVDGEERGDLILFYNSIFMDKLQAFALKFKRSRVSIDAPPLSPLPKLRAHPQSPCRKISDLHPVRTKRRTLDVWKPNWFLDTPKESSFKTFEIQTCNTFLFVLILAKTSIDSQNLTFKSDKN